MYPTRHVNGGPNASAWPDRTTFWQDKRVIATGGSGFLGFFVGDTLRERGAAGGILLASECHSQGNPVNPLTGPRTSLGNAFESSIKALLAPITRLTGCDESACGRRFSPIQQECLTCIVVLPPLSSGMVLNPFGLIHRKPSDQDRARQRMPKSRLGHSTAIVLSRPGCADPAVHRPGRRVVQGVGLPGSGRGLVLGEPANNSCTLPSAPRIAVAS